MFMDLNGNGTEDLVIACQHNGVISDVTAIVYFGSEIGLSEKYKTELTVPCSFGVGAADFKGEGKKSLVFISNNKIRIFPLTDLGYQASVYEDIDIHAVSMTIGDFDGDGLLDIYGTAYTNGRKRDIDSVMYFQGEDRMFHYDNKHFIRNHSGCGCLAGDFNGDGYMDLAVASHKTDGNHASQSYIFWGDEWHRYAQSHRNNR